jgi:hypothetical protein
MRAYWIRTPAEGDPVEEEVFYATSRHSALSKVFGGGEGLGKYLADGANEDERVLDVAIVDMGVVFKVGRVRSTSPYRYNGEDWEANNKYEYMQVLEDEGVPLGWMRYSDCTEYVTHRETCPVCDSSRPRDVAHLSHIEGDNRGEVLPWARPLPLEAISSGDKGGRCSTT